MRRYYQAIRTANRFKFLRMCASESAPFLRVRSFVFLFFQLRKFEIELNREQREKSEMLRSNIAALQEKNAMLEKNLSAETRVKLDLFSALGEARRQIELRDRKTKISKAKKLKILHEIFLSSVSLRNKELQLDDLKSKTAQLLAVMPSVDPQLSNALSPNPSLLDQSDAIASFNLNSQLNAG